MNGWTINWNYLGNSSNSNAAATLLLENESFDLIAWKFRIHRGTERERKTGDRERESKEKWREKIEKRREKREERRRERLIEVEFLNELDTELGASMAPKNVLFARLFRLCAIFVWFVHFLRKILISFNTQTFLFMLNINFHGISLIHSSVWIQWSDAQLTVSLSTHKNGYNFKKMLAT